MTVTLLSRKNSTQITEDIDLKHSEQNKDPWERVVDLV
jgi:hypothetical protein